jgi:hypothetical protein
MADDKTRNFLYCSHRALSIIKSRNIQSNKMHSVVSKYSICRASQSHLFRSLIASQSGIHIKVAFHKTELAVHIHTKRYKKGDQLGYRRYTVWLTPDIGLLCFGDWLPISKTAIFLYNISQLSSVRYELKLRIYFRRMSVFKGFMTFPR